MLVSTILFPFFGQKESGDRKRVKNEEMFGITGFTLDCGKC